MAPVAALKSGVVGEAVDSVGEWLGADVVGDRVGLCVGERLGDDVVGEWLGTDVVGAKLGVDDGARDGDVLGESDGDAVDASISTLRYAHPENADELSETWNAMLSKARCPGVVSPAALSA